MTTPTAAILIIGNEILSGRTQDLNLKFLSKNLNKLGISVVEARVIRDEASQIIEAVRILSRNYTYIFTTGGIGATHDDITAVCVAKAFNKELISHPVINYILEEHYGDQLNEARRRMALVPAGSVLIENPVSKIPAFQIENVFCLAGIPSVMQSMFETIAPQLKRGPQIFQKTLTCAITENTIADDLANIQLQFPEVEIGSYPFFAPDGGFGVSLVLRSTNGDLLQNALEKVILLVKKHVDEWQID